MSSTNGRHFPMKCVHCRRRVSKYATVCKFCGKPPHRDQQVAAPVKEDDKYRFGGPNYNHDSTPDGV